jgi:hypothetical protein
MLRLATIGTKGQGGMRKPKTFEEAKELLGHPELHNMLDQMLIFLAFDQKNSTVAFRAIELLLQRPRRESASVFDDLDDETLRKIDVELSGIYERFGVDPT